MDLANLFNVEKALTKEKKEIFLWRPFHYISDRNNTVVVCKLLGISVKWNFSRQIVLQAHFKLDFPWRKNRIYSGKNASASDHFCWPPCLFIQNSSARFVSKSWVKLCECNVHSLKMNLFQFECTLTFIFADKNH